MQGQMLGLEHVKNTTLITKTPTKREGDKDLRGSKRCLRPHGRREILYDLQEITREL